MRNYRNAVAALVLALALSTSAYAGDGIMHTGVVAPTPTPVPAVNGIMHTGAPEGIMHTDEDESESVAADAVAVIMLNLLQSVLTLF